MKHSGAGGYIFHPKKGKTFKRNDQSLCHISVPRLNMR